MVLPQMKATLVRAWDKAMYSLETRQAGANSNAQVVSVTREN